MNHPALRWSTPLMALLLSVAVVTTAQADSEMWEKRGENCDDTVFEKPSEYELKMVARCVRLFEAYHNGKLEDADKKQKVITAMRRMYQNGSPVDASIARVGLARMGIGVPPKDAKPPKAMRKVAKTKRPARKKFAGCPGDRQPDAPDKKAVKKVKKFFKKGMKAYKKDDFQGALSQFEKMLEVAPGYHSSLYNVATMSAKTGDAKRAIGLLWCLRDIGSDDHIRKVRDARTDGDFESLRRDDRFKVATGYARIVILDTLPEGRGEDNITNLVDRMKLLKYEVIAVKTVSNERTEPWIWYRDTNRIQAFIFKKILAHPHTRIEMMPEEMEKNPLTPDIVIAWGDRYEKDKDPPLRINEAGEEKDNELKDIEKTEKMILNEPDKYENKVDDALGQGDKAVNKVDTTANKIEDLGNKPGETVDKVEKTVDKIKKPFN